MIIHSYLTDGFVGWANLFLSSFKKFHGENIPIVFSTRDVPNKLQDKLKESYKNLYIDNLPIDWDYIINKSGRTKSELIRFKNEVETKKKNLNKNNIVWKQYTSVEDRYRNSIRDTILKYNPNYMLHVDIDIMFNSNLTPLFNLIKDHDITIKFRRKVEKIDEIPKTDDPLINPYKKLVGYCIGFNLSNHITKFLDTWRYHIDALPLSKKPKGYGQYTLYLSYLDHQRDYLWGYMPTYFTIHEKTFTKKRKSKALIFSGSKGNKNIRLKEFTKMFKGK